MAKLVTDLKKLWTAEDDATLRERWLAGDSAAIIGRRLCRTRSSVLGRVHRLHLPHRVSVANQVIRAGGPRSPRKPVSPPEPLPDNVVPIEPHLRTADLLHSHCRWPHDDGADYVYCGHPVRPGFSYCPFHIDAARRKKTK